MKKYYWLAGISAFLWIVVFSQPVAGVRYCVWDNSILTEAGRVELVRQAVLPWVPNDPTDEDYYPEMREDLELMFLAQKKCAAFKGDENCRGTKIDDTRIYKWLYEDNYDGYLIIDFITKNVGQVSIIIGKPACVWNNKIQGGIDYQRGSYK
jgi:hypothetical protein